MTPTTEDLRTTLQAMADAHPAPAPADLLDELRAERTARRTRRGWLAAAGVAAAAVAAVTLTQVWPDPTATGPADEPTGVEPGWELTDGEAPEFSGGLHLLDSTPLDTSGPATVPATGSDAQRYALLWCDTGPALEDPAVDRPGLELDPAGAQTVSIPCLPRDGIPEDVSPVALPPSDQGWEATWQGDLPAAADAVLGIYEEAEHADYPFPGWPDPPLTAPEPGADEVSIDASMPLSAQPVQAGFEGSMMAHATDVTLGPDSEIELWTGVPGRIRVWVDGVLVTDDGDDRWSAADPGLRGGAWTAFEAGARHTLSLPEEVGGEGRTVRVSALASHDAAWQVRVTGADGPQPAEAAVPPLDPAAVPDGVPEWSGGMHRLGVWELPTDGTVAELELPRSVQGQEVTWLPFCPGAEPATLGMATITVGDDPRPERGCADPELGFGFVGNQLDLSEVPEGSSVRVGLPSVIEQETGLVAAYGPVAFEDFDHAAAVSRDWAFSAESVLRAEPEVVARLSLADLDADGSATLVVPAGASILRATSEGVGRVHVWHEGRTVLDPNALSASARLAGEQWWTAWTDDPSTQLVGTHLERTVSAGDELEITVEGYEDGSLTLELLARADG
ncbi:hypothetical protein [Serinicoccus kebangsaanensis]|uniref:hypothetical protein n=1 Tax=Serinicoccus kebangsaanensis TaxID=2602069 RepID=UPI00124E9DEC|nr:hypothetical protein [Serinicoccus kebangsaanensis]